MNWIQKIKRWILTKKFILEEEVTVTSRAVTILENQRDAETKKRVALAFKLQEKQMQSRAMKAHGSDCIDPLTCKKTICFTWEPDKIVEQKQED